MSLNSEGNCVTSIVILIMVHLGILFWLISPTQPLECRSQFDSHACITSIEPRIFDLIKDSQKPIHLKWSIDVIPIHCDCNVIALQTWRLGTGTQGPQTRVRRRSRPSSVFSGRGSSGRGFRFSAGTPGTIMVHGTNFIVRSPKIVFICKGPNHLYGKFLVDLSEEELICQDQHSRNVNG